ncbi:Os10g0176700, partial [Oryza sativa Japonica Group]
NYVLDADHGAVVYPVRRSVAPPAVQHLGDVLGQCNCGAPGCPEMIPAQAQFCCLRCKAAVHCCLFIIIKECNEQKKFSCLFKY